MEAIPPMSPRVESVLPALPATPRKPSPRATASPRRIGYMSPDAQETPLPDVRSRRRDQMIADLQEEQIARQRYARALKHRTQTVHQHAVMSVLLERRVAAMAVRAEMDLITCRNVTRRLAHIEPASEAEQVDLSERFNASLARLFPESKGHMWFKLFQAMDVDKSGRISFKEFCKGVRQVIHVRPEDVQESKVLLLSFLLSSWRHCPTCTQR